VGGRNRISGVSEGGTGGAKGIPKGGAEGKNRPEKLQSGKIVGVGGGLGTKVDKREGPFLRYDITFFSTKGRRVLGDWHKESAHQCGA